MTTENAPPAWGEDFLTSYMEAFRKNQFATFVHKDQAMKNLISIDEIFHRLLNGLINPRPFYPISFMQRAHSAYRTAVGAVMGGQLYEAKALLRLCLEHAAYGFYIGADNGRMERWLRRSDSEANRKSVRKEFHNEKIRAYLKDNAPSLCPLFDRLYNQLIDFGAHPSEQGYLLNSTLRRDCGNVNFQTVYLHSDGIYLNMSLKIAGQVGLWPLHIMQLMYPDLYEQRGLRADLEEVSSRF